MDIVAHGLWAGAAGIAANQMLKKPLLLRWVVAWGMFPDLFAFTATFLVLIWFRLFGGSSAPRGIFSRALSDALPPFLQPDRLYLFSHSLLIFGLVFGAVWLLWRRPVLVMLGWSLHILMDIPSHRAGRYGTPFLWPLSSYRFNGVSWGQDWFFVLNYTALTAVYVALLVWLLTSRRRERLSSSTQGAQDRPEA